MPLSKWQAHLEGHFSALAESRAASGFPTFALEHGLSDNDLDNISAQLIQGLQFGFSPNPFWLLWAIYAAERGYAYSGEEYWHSFEEHTPGWDIKDRYYVPWWFKKFQKAYNGVTPSGPWAEHFRLIAWPITHAILPRYLQVHFARTLYELRWLLAKLTSIEPAVIGRTVAANAHPTSKRFEEFLQQEELVGRIVLAFLHKDPRKGEEPLLPSTLNRIVGDLEQARDARKWLKETTLVVTDRFKGIGQGTGSQAVSGRPSTSGDSATRETLPDVRPNLQLRYEGNDTWKLFINIPSFKSVATLNSDIQRFLRSTRCYLNGNEAKKPAGWVLSGNRRAALNNWPDPQKPLICFDGSNAKIDHILQSECHMSKGPVWLFRINRDGSARQIVTQLVRPGFDYILASKEHITPFNDTMQPCSIVCDDITALHINIPTEVTSEYIHWLKNQGLEIARTIRVWPAGLPGRNWDGEGSSEWLTTEKPCFGIMPDHPIDSYTLTLDNGSSTIIRAGAVGSPSFIQLPLLEVGTHHLTITANHDLTLESFTSEPTHEGFIELKVRDPEPWIPGIASHAGLIVTGDPHDAGLDVLWQNRYALSVVGPEKRNVEVTALLENAKGEVIFSKSLGAPFELPVKPEGWKDRFGDFLEREQCQWNYLEASTGILKISGQELGQITLHFQHEAQPVRWVLQHRQDTWIIRVVDDTGEDENALRCKYFSFENPVRAELPNLDTLLTGIDVQPPGGLFIAQSGNHHDAVVVSTGLTGAGLAGLRLTPHYDIIRKDPASLVKALRIAGYWRDSRLAGFVMVEAWRQQVVDGFLSAVYSKICGSRWANVEATYISKPSQRKVDRLQQAIDLHGSFPAALRHGVTSIEPRISEITAWYTDVAKRYKVCLDSSLCNFAIQLAGCPEQLEQLYPDDLEHWISRLKQHPAVLRGARFIALLSAANNDGGPAMTPKWLI